MDGEQPAQKTSQRKVYKLLPLYRFIMHLVAVGFIAGALAFFAFPWWYDIVLYDMFTYLYDIFFYEPFLFAAFWIIPLAALAAGIYIIYMVRRVSLVLSPERIEADMVEYRLVTTWDNIDRIWKVGLSDALLLRQPVLPEGRKPWGDKVGHIPLTQFGQWWGNGELAQDLRRYAPHLFADEADEEATPPAPGEGHEQTRKKAARQ